MKLLRDFAQTWAEPFRGLVLGLNGGTEVKALDLYDCVPPRGLKGNGRVVLMGDALHQMTMCKSAILLQYMKNGQWISHRKQWLISLLDRGEGANHAIVDVDDFAEHVTPALKLQASSGELRAALDAYEKAVVDRTRPGVLASRRACLDAHEWMRIDDKSPLLTRRVRNLDVLYEC